MATFDPMAFVSPFQPTQFHVAAPLLQPAAFSAPIVLQSTQNIVMRGVKCLVYGPSGSGKTRLVATAPNPVLLSAEGGLLSLRKLNIPFIDIYSMDRLREVYRWCVESNEARQFESIGMDSISEIMEVCLRQEQSMNKDGRKAYGELLIKGIQLTREFRDIQGKHVIVTAKQEWAKDDSSGLMQFAPMLPGSKLGPQLPYYFDEVFEQCVFVNPQDRSQRAEWLRTRTDGQHVAKDRSGALSEWETPNLTAIFQKIQGS